MPVQTELRTEDAEAILAESALAVASAPTVVRSVVTRREGLYRTTGLTGTTADGLRIRNIRPRSGQLFDNADDDERRTVAVIGPVVVLSLFPGIDPVGQELRLGNLRIDVIGVAEPP